MIRMVIAALSLGLAMAACGRAEESVDDGASEGPLGCEHGKYSACACSDGSMGTQLCAHDTSGFEECVCGSDDGTSDPDTSPTGADESSSAASGVDPGTTEDSGPADAGSSTAASDSTSSTETGPIGAPPTAMIVHPGGEDRQAGVAIPFIGVADDPEDGALMGASMIWTDDLEGMIGQGEAFDAILDVVGEHTVTLTATDADGNVGEATLTFAIVP